ncbi:hypothetical protein TIFTF001_002014 [Ficus carica]|uniref:Uncharacterized protein n=1 Tax=Ficus carica TaxID=3494 RepID=A0AA87Z221_FICCA|nr:hypothetical protein TIFTF001_002014 [Ficus carica]
MTSPPFLLSLPFPFSPLSDVTLICQSTITPLGRHLAMSSNKVSAIQPSRSVFTSSDEALRYLIALIKVLV